MAVSDLTTILSDPLLTRAQRLTRLQGWRGAEAAGADVATTAQRIGPLACGVGAALGAALASPLILAAFALTALAGTLGSNHPVEAAYNRWARARGRPPLPANRAAKRLGCAIGFVLLGGAAFAYAVGEAGIGLLLTLVLGGTATFVALTRICVPSMIFTVLLGAERAAAPSLFGVRARVASAP